VFLIAGDPVWMIAAANFTYLIGICMPNIAAWLLRRDMPDAVRPYRAPRGTITLGVIVASIWLVAAILGFQQFGLPTVVFGLALAYSGAALYAWRVMEDRISEGLPALAQTLHVKLTGAMVLVLILDGIAYLAGVNTISAEHHPELVSVLADIFTAVALLTISVGLVLPGMITYSATEVSKAAKRLTTGTLQQFTRAMAALGHGDLDAAHASVNIVPVKPNSRDELGEMAESFNVLQDEVRKAAISLGEARDKMQVARAELLARHAEIAFLAHHDALTNLANRPALSLQLARTLDQAKVTGGNFAVLSVDLDHFKEANDVFGHVICDELLCAIARRLEQAIGNNFIARVGGDEFIIISTGGEQPQTAAQLADRVLKSVEKEFDVRQQKIPIGLSIGAAIYPNDGADTMTLLANADAALYRAKLDGRQMVRFFDPEMDKRLRQRYALQHDLRSAIAHDELLLHYQPQAKIDGEVFGFEALLRWRHPHHGFVPPTTFIPLWRMDAARGLPRGRFVDRADADRHQPVARAISLRRFGRPRPFHLARDGTCAGTTRARDHRRRAHRRSAAGSLDPAPPQAPRCQDRHGRFRHRLRLAVLAAILPLRQDQDRPHFRLWSGPQRSIRGDRTRRHRPRQSAQRPRDRRRRRDRGRALTVEARRVHGGPGLSHRLSPPDR
jgi:diguanylate cyclase (GGDEF)-like protein